MPDLSAYPVIRIDQIAYVPSDTLRAAVSEVMDLVETMNSDKGPKPPLLSYLRRQLEQMHAELVDRGARDRISRLISGTNLVGVNDSYIGEYRKKPVDFACSKSEEKRETLPTGNSTGSSRKVVKSVPVQESIQATVNSTYTRIPLPSEIAWQVTSKKKLHENDQNVTPPSVPSAEFSSADIGGAVNRPVTTSEMTMRTSRSESAVSVSNDDDVESIKKERIGSRHSSVTSANSSVKIPRRSAVMSNNNPVKGSPSKKATAALYKDFGSQFLVAATEKKLRFYPTKIVIETNEELKERGRKDR